jgi:DNA modification methylase
MAEPKHLNLIPIDHIVQSRPNIPSDYHCTCPYCQNFMGEIYNVENDKYYSNRIRRGYYIDQAGDHLDAGHIIGYKWAVQNLCPKGGFVFDPTVGTGTAIIEAILNGRNGIGIELEYPEVAQKNIDNQWNLNRVPPGVTSYFRQGDATKLDEYFKEWGFKEPFLDLIINGTPYPKISGKSSDAPERKNLATKVDKSFDYMHEDNIGLTKGNAYHDLVKTMYTKAIRFLKPGGYFVIIIKDLVQNKEPYLLHKEIIDIVIENNPDMVPYGFFLHKHIPTTMFINTYLKRFPGIQIPLYQAGIVLRKRGNFLDPGYPVEYPKVIREINPLDKKINPIKKSVPIAELHDLGYQAGLREGYNEAIKDFMEFLKKTKKWNY